MKTSEAQRKKWFKIRVTEDELKRIKALGRSSICKSASDYARKVLMQKPVFLKYHNESADEILSELIRLKRELNSIGNNFNQAVHTLHTLDRVPEIKLWLIQNETIKQSFLEKVEEVRLTMIQIHKQWLQK